jgi:hypothetical protein
MPRATFLQGHGISEREIETVWTAIALHTTPGIPEHMHPEIALLQARAGMDVAGRREATSCFCTAGFGSRAGHALMMVGVIR